MKEARFYEIKAGKANCFLCNRRCVIPEGGAGYCRVRKNVNGKLQSLVYGKTLTLTVDPIEKKPLFNFMPGTFCNSVSTYGCNFHCEFCQNHHISQDFVEENISVIKKTTPKEIVENTLELGVEGIAYTYTEPTIFAEYALDTMKLAKKEGLYNVWVSNGYMSKEAVEVIAKDLDAINIDLKGNAEFYKKMCGNVEIGRVMDSIRFFHGKGVHVEVTNLIVPGYNDSLAGLGEIIDFIASTDKRMPLHFSRFIPHFNMLETPITPIEVMKKAKELAVKAGLKYVYLGNVPGAQDSFCPVCGRVLVERKGFETLILGLKKSKCGFCGAETGFRVRP